MSEEQKTEETKTKKKGAGRKPSLYYGFLMTGSKIEEIEFESKTACVKWLNQEQAKTTGKDGWTNLKPVDKTPRAIKILVGRVVKYKMISVGDIV